MIVTILIVSLAFYWLLYETDYLRVRLLCGAYIQIIEYQHQSWEEIEPKIKSMPDRFKPFWYKYPEHMHPLCGMDWLENTQHAIPEYHFYMTIGGCRYTMNIKKDNVLKDVMRVNHLTKQQKLAYA